MNNGGNFALNKEALPAMMTSGSSVAANDFDKDGDMDLLIGGRLVPRRLSCSCQHHILRNNGGKFSDVTAEIALTWLKPVSFLLYSGQTSIMTTRRISS